MPMYEYKCGSCGEIYAKFFKMADKPKTYEAECPSCKEYAEFESIISAVAMSYNGVNHASKVPSDMKTRLNQIRQHYPDMQSSI